MANKKYIKLVSSLAVGIETKGAILDHASETNAENLPVEETACASLLGRTGVREQAAAGTVSRCVGRGEGPVVLFSGKQRVGCAAVPTET